MKEYVKKINIPMCLLVLLTGRMLFADSAYAIAIFGLGMVGLFAYDKHLASKVTKSLDQKVAEELERMKTVISNVSIKNFKQNPTENQRFF